MEILNKKVGDLTIKDILEDIRACLVDAPKYESAYNMSKKKIDKYLGMIPNRRESVANRFSLDELENAFNNYKPRKNTSGAKNGMFVDGNGEKYTRIRINKTKVRLSHIVWRINNKQKIPIGCNIHHRDENKRNNASSNLECVDAVIHANQNLKKLKGRCD